MMYYFSGLHEVQMSTECLPFTETDNDGCPAHLIQKPDDVTETRDSDACSSEHQANTYKSVHQESPQQPGDPKGSDDVGIFHDPAMLNQPRGAVRPVNSWPSANVQNRQSLIGESQSARGFIQMPPTPDQIPMLPDASPSGRKFTWVEALEHNTSLLDDQSLYRAFQLRRRHHAETAGPKLFSAMAEYLGDAEEKLANLQQSLQSIKEQTTELQGEMPARDERTDGQDTPIPADPLDDVSLETRFYPCEDGFALMTGRVKETGLIYQTPRGHYTSSYEPNYLIRVQFEWMKPASSRQAFFAKDKPDAKDIDVLTFMVSSRPLTVFFERRLGLKVDRFPVLKFGKPFRVVISNHGLFKNHLSYLMSKYGSGRERHIKANSCKHSSNCESSSQTDEPTAASGLEDEKESQIFDQRSAIDHFRLLVEFIEQYLGEKVALFEALQTGRTDMIAFEDLWMLFNNGQMIVCPLRENRVTIDIFNGKPGLKNDNDDDSNRYHFTRRRYVPQAYRVTAAVGGAPLISSLAPKSSYSMRDQLSDDRESDCYYGGLFNIPTLQGAKRRLSSLQVSCMCVDFDGIKYGTDMEIFVFKPFDGQVPVKTLEAYPLNYSIKPGSDDLVRRGRKFIDLAASPRHMNHAGITIGETKEEVRIKTWLYLVQSLTLDFT